jgi:serine/threonine protein kinase
MCVKALTCTRAHAGFVDNLRVHPAETVVGCPWVDHLPLLFAPQPYTEYISTRWYRAPECLLTDGYYGFKMDMWGIGCVIFEVLALVPLFPGADEADQIARIHKIMGTPPRVVSRRSHSSR